MTKLGIFGIGLLAYLVDVGLFYLLFSLKMDFYILINIIGKLVAFLSAFFLLKMIATKSAGFAIRTKVVSALIVMNIFLATCLLFITVDLIKMPIFFAKLGTDAVVILMSFVVGRYIMRHMVPTD
jgi:putative flippase GtrA